jgi:hypothetical protein
MIRNYFLIIFRVFSGWFLYVFGIRSKLYYASVYLFSKQSFRLPQSAKSDYLIIFKSYYNTIKQILGSKPEVKKLSEGNSAALDSSYAGLDTRLNYLNHFGIKPDIFLSRQDLLGGFTFGHKISAIILASKMFSFFWFGSFSRNRASYALVIREAVEWFNIFIILRRNKIEKLYMFCIYEKDSNMLAYLLMKRGIKVNKITSEVPLTFANKIIIANEISLGFNYQNEELEAYKDSMFYNSVQTWFPEAQGGYLKNYADQTFSVPANTIGFYSSAFWLRKKINHSIADVGSYDAEEVVLKYVLDYIKERENLNLIIFTHPYERKTNEIFEQTRRYYNSIISPDLTKRVEIAGKETNSTLTFNKVNIGISLFSTVMFERINLGFKTILAPIDKKDFPLLSSPFRNICAYSEEELFNKLDKNVSLSKDDFFKMNRIENYVSTAAGIKYNLV